jgi:hypothetical protein
MKPFKLTSPRAHPERDLQASIVAYFAAVVRPGDAILFAVPNGEKRDPSTASMLTGRKRKKDAEVERFKPDEAFLVPAGQGVLPGAVDLILLTDGAATTLIEVKVPELAGIPGLTPDRKAGRLSRPQRIFRDAAVRLAHLHVVVYSIEDFDAVLRSRQVPVKALPFPRLYGLPAGFKPG